MEFGILGPLVVWEDGRELPVGPPKQRAVLALLLLRRGELVPTATIVDLLWGERAPPAATKTVQVYVSQLRKALGAGVVETLPLGYSLRVEAGMLDLDSFEELLGRGRRLLGEGDAEQAAEVLRRALGLWRGPPLADFRYDAFARDETARLEKLRLVAIELNLEAGLALGRHAEAVPELEALVHEHPLRESLWRLLMLALYRAGRQADALAAYQQARAALVDELGLEPNESLQQLETAILRHDPTLDLPPAPAAPPEPEQQVAHERVRPAWRRPVFALAAGAVVFGTAAAAAAVLLTRSGPGSAVAARIDADSVGVFRAENGKPVGQITVGSSPGAVASGDGSLWVANVDAHSVSRVDPVKQAQIETIPVGNGPAGIAFGGGFVWVTDGLDGTVSKIDPETNTPVDTITVGNGPAGVAVGARYVWVANSNDGTVTRIDLRTDKALSPISVGESAEGVAVGHDSVWVTSESTGSVTRIDARSGTTVANIFTGSGADAVAVGERAVWVANNLDDTVSRIDPTSNRPGAAIPVGDGPNGIVSEGGSVWVSNELSGTLSRIDPARSTVVQRVRTGNRPQGIVLDSGELFVAVRASGAGHRGGTLRVLTTEGADLTAVGLDLARAYNPLQIRLASLTNDGLTGYRRVGGLAGSRLVPDLAVSLPEPTDGGRSYGFRLRPGIRYSTGALVRPQDFRRAIERSLVSGTPAVAASLAGIVGASECLAAPKEPCDLSAGIVADPRSNTVTFHLTGRDPDFLYKLALPQTFAVPAGTPLEAGARVPATGPYEIASFVPKRMIRLVRNPRFREWSPLAQPDGFPDVILMRFAGSPDEHAAAVVRGSADLAWDYLPPSPAVMSSLRTQHRSLLQENPIGGTEYLALNTRVAPFDDLRVRRALNLAVDRNRLRELTAGEGLGLLTCQPMPPNLDGYRRYCPYTAGPDGSQRWTGPDLERARRLVRSSGTAGQEVLVLVPTFLEGYASAARYVVSVLESLGYRARFRYAAFPYKKHMPMQASFFAWSPDYFAPAGFFLPVLTCDSITREGSPNFAEFCNPAIDRKIERARALQTSDPEAASRLWTQVDHDIVDEAPWVPFVNPVRVTIVSDRVSNYQYHPWYDTLVDQLWVR